MRFFRIVVRSLPVFCLASAVSLGGCGSADIVDIRFGGLTVDTITDGPNPDPNAYSLQVTGPSLNVEQTIGRNDRVVFSAAPGAYTVRLNDIAANCVPNANPVDATISTGVTTGVVFRVVCA